MIDLILPGTKINLNWAEGRKELISKQLGARNQMDADSFRQTEKVPCVERPSRERSSRGVPQWIHDEAI